MDVRPSFMSSICEFKFFSSQEPVNASTRFLSFETREGDVINLENQTRRKDSKTDGRSSHERCERVGTVYVLF